MSLEDEVRSTKTLLGNRPVYQNADIKIAEIHPDEVSPRALYVMLPGVMWLLDKLASGVNIFGLKEVEEGEDFRMGPPVVEWSDNSWGIVDGIHRFWLAKVLNRKVSTIMVAGADPEIPMVGMPVEWYEVQAYEVKPEDPKLLKRLRPGIEDTGESLRSHYRDLRYLGGRGRRPREGQNG